MIAAPAIDVRGGRCVQLVGGRPEEERVSLPDPLAVAERWWQAGFAVLHVVDLDAALGDGDNLDLVLELTRSTPAITQVGGGVRDDQSADRLLDEGADRVIVGTRALADPAWLERLSARWPGRVMVAADHRGGRVLSRGWTVESELMVSTLMARLAPLPLAGVLCTDVAREGRLGGIDAGVVTAHVESATHPYWASGGIRDEIDLERLDAAGAAGAVMGMAIYTGSLDPTAAAARFGGRVETSTRRTR